MDSLLQAARSAIARLRLRGLHPGTRVVRRGDPAHGVYSGQEDGLAVCTFAGQRVRLPLEEITIVREGRAR